jgi:hypothetical protein
MAQTQANVAALFKETYREHVPELLERTNTFYARIKAKGDTEKAGPRTLRIPKKMSPGGQFRTFSQDGGDMGRGNAPIFDVATLTPKPVLEAVEFNQSVRWNTANDQIAVLNALTDNVADATDEWGVNVDKSLQGNADGILATMSSGATTTSWTLAAPMRARLLRINSRVLNMDSAQAGYRGAPTASTITSIDDTTGVVTVDAAPAGQTNTDVIVVDGLTGATPAWLNGIKNLHNSSSSGTVMGLSRVTYPQIRTPNQTLSSAITAAAFRAGINAVEILRGPQVWDSGDWAVYGNPAQRQAVEELGISMNLYDKTGGKDGFDPLFDVGKLRVNGFKYVSSRNADPTRLDLVDFANWFKGETLPVGLYDVEDDTMFPIYGTSGGLAAAEIFYVVGILDFGIDDFQRASIWSSLSVPSGSLYF